MLKLEESEVEQLEPDLEDHYTRLQSLATALGRGFMLYHRVKQASQCLLHARVMKCKQASCTSWRRIWCLFGLMMLCNWVSNRRIIKMV